MPIAIGVYMRLAQNLLGSASVSAASVCVGAPLARLEAEIAIPALITRLDGLRLETDRLEWLDSLIFRGVRSLYVGFRPAVGALPG